MSEKKPPQDIFLLDETRDAAAEAPNRAEPAPFLDTFETDAVPETEDMFSLWRTEPALAPRAAEIVDPEPVSLAVAPAHIRLLPLYRRSVPTAELRKLHDTLTQELELSTRPALYEFLLRAFLKTTSREQLPFRGPCIVHLNEAIRYEPVAIPAASSFTEQLDRATVMVEELPPTADALLIDLTEHAADDVLLHETLPTITMKRVVTDEGEAVVHLAVRGDVTPLQANSLLAGMSWLLSEPLRLVL